MAITLNTNEKWEPTAEQIEQWVQAYPAVDVQGELRAMAAWSDANPTRRKTKRGISRFCVTWLSRAQDKGGSGLVKQRPGAVSTKSMTTLDDLTHDFTNSESYRAYCLEKYGQYFSHTGERVTG